MQIVRVVTPSSSREKTSKKKKVSERNCSRIKNGKAAGPGDITDNVLKLGFYVRKDFKKGCCLSPTILRISLEEVLKTQNQNTTNMGILLT